MVLVHTICFPLNKYFRHLCSTRMGSVFCGLVCLHFISVRQALGSPSSPNASSPGNQEEISAWQPHLSLQSPHIRSSFVLARSRRGRKGVSAHPWASVVWWGPGETSRDVGQPSPAFSTGPDPKGAGAGALCCSVLVKLGARGWGLSEGHRSPSSLLGVAGLLPLEVALWGTCSGIRPCGPQPQLILPKYSPGHWQSPTSSDRQQRWDKEDGCTARDELWGLGGQPKGCAGAGGHWQHCHGLL